MTDKKIIPYKEFKESMKELMLEDNIGISLDFISNSFFNCEKYLSEQEQYNEGFKKGLEEKLYNHNGISKISMEGITQDLLSVYPRLLKLKNDFDSMGWSLEDAGYHGWSGEALKNIYSVVDKQENMIDECIFICQIALGLGIDRDAWRVYGTEGK